MVHQILLYNHEKNENSFKSFVEKSKHVIFQHLIPYNSEHNFCLKKPLYELRDLIKWCTIVMQKIKTILGAISEKNWAFANY